MFSRSVLFLSFALASVGSASVKGLQEQQDARANPIRKVVTMLQNMQKKVSAEGEKEKALFEKFMCYCKNSDSTLAASISDGETKVEQLDTSIKANTAEKAQLEEELKAAQVGRVEAKDAMTKATAIREKEAAVYAKES